MWTFDRYQRWMEQVDDWVRSPQAAALRTMEASVVRSAPASRAARPLSIKPNASAANQTRAAPSQPPSKPPQQPPAKPLSSTAPADEVIEVPAEEMDLAALAELAKKVVERKPP